jgi:hypothetical protein
MDADQAFEFDLHGVLVVKGVLDQATVNELRTTMSQKMKQDDPAVQEAGNGTGRVRGNPLGTGASMLHWGKPCRSFHPRFTSPASTWLQSTIVAAPDPASHPSTDI